ncbi:MAG: peroxiredoxin [Bdellovibrionales bacterium]|nr:peroxiredoxin [Bdellovibrionales bacterium]NQZ18353.1 peroxiredoxin [Bdellovibrionales bacterium]
MAKTVEVGKKVPAFKAEATNEEKVQLSKLKGQKVVIYFYPKDNTPGCTTESNDFSANYKKFQKAGAEIFGVSRDSMTSHEKFKSKFDFPFELISDPEEELCEIFDVIKEKNMYGKKVMGIERSTFVIDENGKLIKEWRKVRVPGHVDEVLDFVKNN